MTLFEKIQLNAKHMKYSIVMDENGDYKIVSPFRDCDGEFRETPWEKNIEKAEELIGEEVGVSEMTWDLREYDGCRYVGVWHTPQPEGYKEGDLVDLPDTEEVRAYCNRYLSAARIKPGMQALTVKYDDGESVGVGLVSEGSTTFGIPSYLLIPHIPTDEETKGQDGVQEEPITREEVREIIREELGNRPKMLTEDHVRGICQSLIKYNR